MNYYTKRLEELEDALADIECALAQTWADEKRKGEKLEDLIDEWSRQTDLGKRFQEIWVVLAEGSEDIKQLDKGE